MPDLSAREIIARWAGDPGNPISEADWAELSAGFRAFLLSRADILLEELAGLPLMSDAQ
jgi:hypothetical protein